MKKCRIIIIEPSEIIVSGLKTLIDNKNKISVVASFKDTYKIDEKIDDLTPDLIILNPLLLDYHKRLSIKHLFPQHKIVALLYGSFDREILNHFHGIIEICDEPQKIIHIIETVMKETVNKETNSENCDLSELEK